MDNRIRRKHEPFILPTVVATGCGAVAGSAFELRRIQYLANTTAENRQAFLNDPLIGSSKGLYTFVSKHYKNPALASRVNEMIAQAVTSKAMACAALVGAGYVAYRAAKALIKTMTQDKKVNLVNDDNII